MLFGCITNFRKYWGFGRYLMLMLPLRYIRSPLQHRTVDALRLHMFGRASFLLRRTVPCIPVRWWRYIMNHNDNHLHVDAVHQRKITRHVCKIDVDLHDVLEPWASSLEDDGQIIQSGALITQNHITSSKQEYIEIYSLQFAPVPRLPRSWNPCRNQCFRRHRRVLLRSSLALHANVDCILAQCHHNLWVEKRHQQKVGNGGIASGVDTICMADIFIQIRSIIECADVEARQRKAVGEFGEAIWL